jgi:hypothetical protein
MSAPFAAKLVGTEPVNPFDLLFGSQIASLERQHAEMMARIERIERLLAPASLEGQLPAVAEAGRGMGRV